jgi:hypothetical protein
MLITKTKIRKNKHIFLHMQNLHFLNDTNLYRRKFGRIKGTGGRREVVLENVIDVWICSKDMHVHINFHTCIYMCENLTMSFLGEVLNI